MSSSESGNGNTLTYRVTQIERELEKLETRWDSSFSDLRTQLGLLIRDVAVLSNNLDTHTENIYKRLSTLEANTKDRLEQLEGSVNEDVKGLRKVLIGAGISVLIGAVMFAITSLAVFGGPG